jgi:hypothetical protein
MTPYEYIKKCVSIKIAPSRVHGVGIFAMRDIEPGEDIFTNWEGKSGLYYLTESEVNTFDDNVKSHLYDMFEYTKKDDQWLFMFYLNQGCHWIFKSPLNWVNSCSYDETPNIDKDTLKCVRRINSGDELFTKYGKYEKFRTNRADRFI